MQIHYFLNIGSNLGNPLLNISRAVRALEEEFGYFELSKKFESEPWGYESANHFTNIAMMVISDITPEEMLKKIKAIESKLGTGPHRKPDGTYADRIIDIDIMAADELEITSGTVQIPHPAIAEREFFLVPFEELAPEWRHPATGKSCAEMLEALRSTRGE
ncbi:MAG: 2-amino-4-hydroxy-6-hydroxymethyldihydropteridine diphosphokinase [Candidatus Amulumruptor caecigallinarius]|nr:2-amino-4-hydroxy-6-hydroxymethyldihydropteridine diphosphokinase [Candidatus Amulumruptor caecigallinarius]